MRDCKEKQKRGNGSQRESRVARDGKSENIYIYRERERERDREREREGEGDKESEKEREWRENMER